jgi:hypothetical protein
VGLGELGFLKLVVNTIYNIIPRAVETFDLVGARSSQEGRPISEPNRNGRGLNPFLTL